MLNGLTYSIIEQHQPNKYHDKRTLELVLEEYSFKTSTIRKFKC